MKKEFYPGWKMTVSQQHRLIRLWSAACRAQGWHKIPQYQREQHRKEVLTRVFGRETSFTEIDHRKGCDDIFRELERLANIITDDDGDRKRLLHNIGEQMANLNDLVAPDYISTLLKDRFKVIEGVRTISDLSNKQLGQRLITLKSRIETISLLKPPQPF